MTLGPPVEPMPAQAVEAVPPPAALRAGVAYEQKLDGHRALLFTAAGPGGTVLVRTRRGALVQDGWPDLVAAAEARLPPGLVLDGELVVWDAEAGRLSFEALQRRATVRPTARRRPVWSWPWLAELGCEVNGGQVHRVKQQGDRPRAPTPVPAARNEG
ncbi:hypothetical protein [Streptomyces sp. NRRL S-237]|uniref:ATP-dependent DNA ligase n=1 Tax=Streptomyces sp. NRRL S-237 TaxID=1463895 RepID=UPI000ACE88ED|nr:hypothetical protein [Streptomyces sp. NRRL S-237]